MARRVYLVVEEREPWTAALMVVVFLVGAVVWVVITFWRWLVLAVLIYLAARYVWERHRAMLAERYRLCAQADKEHAAVLRGDPYGIYGQYRPAVESAVDRIVSHRRGRTCGRYLRSVSR
jgi:hypothetical protein